MLPIAHAELDEEGRVVLWFRTEDGGKRAFQRMSQEEFKAILIAGAQLIALGMKPNDKKAS